MMVTSSEHQARCTQSPASPWQGGGHRASREVGAFRTHSRGRHMSRMTCSRPRALASARSGVQPHIESPEGHLAGAQDACQGRWYRFAQRQRAALAAATDCATGG
eukprot:6219243-Prymnesium_polylepis.3